MEISLLFLNPAAQSLWIQYTHHESILRQQKGPPGGPGTSCCTRDNKIGMVIDQGFAFSPQVRG